MALVATLSTKEPRSFSIGPLKIQVYTVTAASADTSGTITAAGLKEVFHVVLDGKFVHTAAPTFSGNVVTLAFADPGVSGAFGTAILIGR